MTQANLHASAAVDGDRAARTRPALIDCDVHPYLRSTDLSTLAPYLPSAWRERFAMKKVPLGATVPTLRFCQPAGGSIRPDSVGPGGGPGASDPEFVAAEVFETLGATAALLSSLQCGALAAALAGPDESIVICSAFNDYFLEEWVAVDPRFKLAICIPPQDPAAASEEIHRLAGRSGVAAVFVPPTTVLMGNRYLHPIYEAAVECDLPIFSHVTGADMIYQGAPAQAVALPESFVERRMSFPQIAESNLASLVFSGVFERFPALKVLFVEFGFSWAVPHIWRMDSMWKNLRMEVPWVKRWPREYVHDHVRFTTQPMEEPANRDDLLRLIEMLGREMLLFSTDYPHWDGDDPGYALRFIPRDLREQILAGNAQAFLGW
jgi:predicted TIM-barrel fold metal-dependent hydrolase